MLYTGMERIPVVHLENLDELMEDRAAEYVKQEADNRLPLVSKVTYEISDRLSPPNHQMVALRWSVAVGYTDPLHLTAPGQLLYWPIAKGNQLLELVSKKHSTRLELAALKAKGLNSFFTVVTLEKVEDGSLN